VVVSSNARVRAASRGTQRLAWADRLKVVTVAGVVVAHVGTAYVVDVGWYYEERTTSDVTPAVLGVPVVLAAVYGLAPLFLVGGSLAAASLSRRGPASFARSRLLRLGLPAALFLLLVDPLADFLGGWVQGEPRSFTSYLLDPGGDRDLGPAWFIVALLAFSLAYAAWRGLRPARPARAAPEGPTPGRPTPLGPRLLAVVAAVVAVADVVVWLRWSYFTDSPWNVNWQHWPQAAGLFALGAAAGERGRLEVGPRLARRCGWVALGGSLAFTALAGYGFAIEDTGVTGGLRATALAFAVVDGATAVALSVWVVAWFSRRWNAPPGPVVARAARGSYAAYLLHPLVLVGLGGAMLPLPWVPEVKFVVGSVLAVPTVLLAGYLATRLPGASHVL
jgi:hypothetical protein